MADTLRYDVNGFIENLKQMVMFIKSYKLVTEDTELAKLKKLEVEIAVLNQDNVNLLNYNFKGLYRICIPFIHPDKYATIKEESLRQKIEEITTIINSGYQQLASDINHMKQLGETECYIVREANNQQYANAGNQQANQQQSSNYGYQQSEYNESKSYSRYQEQPNKSYEGTYKQKENQQEEYYESDYREEVETTFDFFKGIFNFHFRKIPRDMVDYQNIKQFYATKIQKIVTKINGLNNRISNIKRKIQELKNNWNQEASVQNVERLYNNKLEQLYQKMMSAQKTFEVANEDLDRREEYLKLEIDGRFHAFQIHYNDLSMSYQRECQMFVNGNNQNVLNSTYPGTEKTYRQVLTERYTYLNSHRDMNQNYKQIVDSVYDADSIHRNLEEGLNIANNNYHATLNALNDYQNHALNKKNDIVNQINYLYQEKIRKLEEESDNLVRKFKIANNKKQETESKFAEFLRQYKEYEPQERGQRR